MTTLSDIPPESRPYQPFGAAKHLFYCRDREILIEGPTRTGKSRGVLEKVLLCMMKWPNARALLLRKTRASMSESVLQTFEDHVLPVGSPIKSGPKRDQRSNYTLPNESKIIVGGLDNTDRIMSSEYDMIAIFEATECKEEEVEDLLTRLSNTKMPFRQLILDCNPGAPSHWLNKRAAPAENVDRDNYESVQQFNLRAGDTNHMRRLLSRLEDNPVMYDQSRGEWRKMGEEYRSTIQRIGGVRYKRKVQGIWAATEGMVYPEFPNHIVNAGNHRVPDRLPSPALRVCAGLDWGWSDPLAVVIGAECHDSVVRIVEEFYETKVPPDVLAVKLRELMVKWNIELFFCDPARPELIALMRRYNIPCIAHRVRLIETGIALVESRLNAGYLETYSCCVNLIREVDEYEYAKDKNGNTKTVPVDQNNHTVDAMRYLIAGMDFGRTLAFSPLAKEATDEILLEEPTPETLQRLGFDPAHMEEEKHRAEEAEAHRRMMEFVNGDEGWNG
jgi:PBSX family phage terminase large subunit